MSLIQWDPFREMEQLMSRLPATQSASVSQLAPAVNMYEEKGNLIVKTPLAGVHADDVEVHIEGGALTIKGEDKSEHEVEEKNYYRKEIRSGSFFRRVPLPIDVDESSVTAQFEDGVLTVSAPIIIKDVERKVKVKVVKRGGDANMNAK
jgi:HSP20 family protein